MSIELRSYISFKDSTKEAMEFYKSIFGGELEVHTFKEFNASSGPAEDNLIMHAKLTAPNDIVFMASDTPDRMEYKPGTNFSMSLGGDSETELNDYFKKLSEGGTVTMPLAKQVWGDTFGMCLDRFGISWMVNITAPKTEA